MRNPLAYYSLEDLRQLVSSVLYPTTPVIVTNQGVEVTPVPILNETGVHIQSKFGLLGIAWPSYTVIIFETPLKDYSVQALGREPSYTITFRRLGQNE